MKTKHLLIAIAVTCLWGFNFSVIKLGVEAMDPLILAGFRFTFAAIPAVFFIKRPNVKLTVMISYGLLFGVGVWGLMNLAIYTGVSAGMAGLIIEFTVFISVIFGVVFLKEKLSNSRIIGLLFAFVGLGMILTIEDGSVTLVGIILGLLAAVAWSCISLIIRKAQIKQMFAFIVWSCLFAPLPLFALAYLVNGQNVFNEVQSINGLGLFSILFQAFITTLLGYWVWNRLMTIYPMSVIAPLNLLVPIFGLIGSTLFYDEEVSLNKVLAFSIITLGVMIPMGVAWYQAALRSLTKIGVLK
ncbi:EamA family transporter [Endozoicomonas sp. SM1973]|uniref:EamA family transporter n=1 Tax=Spartinivicinus marinus TaxID=2994442 RepID=A0A853HW66_9GAMM|nr:EamA family transporter [Spartinivicinus marinus]MCX4026815.1 EamA family transporter [Spartinivicinus marinus]NYZ64649.1 EamA family transporter [Spartinivicinus marinus]